MYVCIYIQYSRLNTKHTRTCMCYGVVTWQFTFTVSASAPSMGFYTYLLGEQQLEIATAALHVL